MTREEALKELKILKEDYWDDDGYGHETKQYDDTMLALDMAIKALERESVLDKIRVEIEDTYTNITYQENKDRKATWGLRKALDIIDKYKGESERG